MGMVDLIIHFCGMETTAYPQIPSSVKKKKKRKKERKKKKTPSGLV